MTVTHAATFAEIMGVISSATGVVVTVKLALSRPGATVTVTGTLAKSDELERWTTCPPTPAFAAKPMTPSTDSPPITDLSTKVTELTHAGADAAGLMVNGAETVLAEVAVMVAVVVDDTGLVFTANIAAV